jgi:hypothetical protein
MTCSAMSLSSTVSVQMKRYTSTVRVCPNRWTLRCAEEGRDEEKAGERRKGREKGMEGEKKL